MSKRHLTFVCQNCGAASSRWQGKCEACGEWNTLSEEGAERPAGPGRKPGKGRLFALEPLAGEAQDAPRLPFGIAEFDRVTGGGFVRGSVLLVGGDPGIGKSTLLIQATAALARAGHRAVYISGEEAVAQVRLRAERLGLRDAAVELAAETSVEDIIATLSEGKTPRLIVIDSIQTMWTDTVESAPGTVTQVRGSAQALIRFAKKSGAAIILVGHVTKDGQIAGPRVVEHMVDAVLSFEGEGSHQFRILRAVKNRFGPTDEIGVFEMTGSGLREVPIHPSCFYRSAILASQAPRCSPASKEQGHCWSKSKLWLRRHRSGRPGVLWWDGTRAGSLCCSRCWRPIAASGWEATTFTLTLPAACAYRSRRAILRPQPRLCPRSPMRRCPRTQFISAKCRCPARFDRWHTVLRVSRKRQSLASIVPSCRMPGAPRLASRGLRLSMSQASPIWSPTSPFRAKQPCLRKWWTSPVTEPHRPAIYGASKPVSCFLARPTASAEMGLKLST